ncbi:MAG TPA: hypothetical protein VM142_03765 [Acidimicrobiales bacterium]|nr:hypothetical protein [Acidimicrobiales bacterium]
MSQPVPTFTSTSSTAPSAHPGLFHALEKSGRFRRDTALGGILHRGKVSLREVSRSDSVHVIIDGNRVSAHVDRVCPLDGGDHERTRYSLVRVVAHNLSDVVSSGLRRLRGLNGSDHCQLECEMVWVDDEDEPVIECVTASEDSREMSTR